MHDWIWILAWLCACVIPGLNGLETTLLEYKLYYSHAVQSPRNFYKNVRIPKNATNIHLGAIFDLTDPITGDIGLYGVPRVETLRCLVNKINAGGYGNNRSNQTLTLSWDAIDSQANPAEAVAAAYYLSQDNRIPVVIGPNDSQETFDSAAAMLEFGVGVVSYSSSAIDILNYNFNNLLRTLPNDDQVNQAFLDFFADVKWGLIGAIFTTDAYGLSGLNFFLEAQQRGVINMTCLTKVPLLTSDETIKDATPALQEMAECLSTSMANVVMIFSSVTSASPILKVLTSNPANSRLTYVSTAWITFVDDPAQFSYGYFDISELKGTIAVTPTVGNVSEFEDYYYSLNPGNNNYTYFLKFWEYQFACIYDDSNGSIPLCSPNLTARTFPPTCRCTGNENLSQVIIDLKVGYVWDSILGVWYAIQKIIFECDTIPQDWLTNKDLCSMDTFGGIDIVDVMRNNVFEGTTGKVSFVGTDRDSPFCDIYQIDAAGRPTKIGSHNATGLTYNSSLFAFKDGSAPPSSYIVPSNFTFSTVEGAIIGSIAGVLLLITLYCVWWVFKHKQSPPIKRLSPLFLLVILGGVICLLVGSIIGLVAVTGGTCFFKILLTFLGLGLIFGSLIAKSYRIYKIFLVIRVRRRSYSNKELLAFVGIVASIQVSLILLLVIIEGWPSPTLEYSAVDPLYSFTACYPFGASASTVIFFILIAVNITFIVVAAVLALLTRNVRSEYNESRNIGLCIAGIGMIIILTIALSVTLGNTEKRVFYRDVLIVACSIIVSVICLLFLIFPLFLRWTKHAKAIYRQKSTSIRSPEEGYSESFAEYYYPPPAGRVRLPTLTYNGHKIHHAGSSFTNWAHSSVDTGTQTRSASSAKLSDFSDPDFSVTLQSESGRTTPKIESMSLVDEESTFSLG